jgi:DNA invertase Pin-like site-specific DNA recombinase
MKKPVVRKLRCAIYTRKSTEEGLDMEFNSLDAQREACSAYIASQRAEGWVELAEQYDDGGYSGGTLERPALKRLLAEIESGRVDVVVVYKIDRLSRALMDFARLVEVFDRHGVTFVSVTQSFNTTTSMGRLTLNVLLSFAQFEREVIGERIRDKVAASRKRGMWMGGFVPMGYRVENRKLVIHEAEAAVIRIIFQRFLKVGSATAAKGRGRSQSTWAHHRQRQPLPDSAQPSVRRPRRAQGRRLSRRARADPQPGPLGQGAVDSAGESKDARLSLQGGDTGVAKGPSVRPERPRHEPYAHPARRQALSLLRVPGSAKGRGRRQRDQARVSG